MGGSGMSGTDGISVIRHGETVDGTYGDAADGRHGQPPRSTDPASAHETTRLRAARTPASHARLDAAGDGTEVAPMACLDTARMPRKEAPAAKGMIAHSRGQALAGPEATR